MHIPGLPEREKSHAYALAHALRGLEAEDGKPYAHGKGDALDPSALGELEHAKNPDLPFYPFYPFYPCNAF